MVLMVLPSKSPLINDIREHPLEFLAASLISMGDEKFVHEVIDSFDAFSSLFSDEDKERVVAIFFDRLYEIWPEEIRA